MPRILHLIPDMHDDAGPAPAAVRRLAALAPRHGWESSVLTTTEFAEDEAGLRAGFGDFAEAVVLPRLSRLGELVPPGGIRHAVADAAGAADLVLLHGLWHPLVTGAARACRRLAKPYLVMPHGRLDAAALGGGTGWRRAYLLVLQRSMLAGAAGVVFASPAEEAAARRLVPGLPDALVLPAGEGDGAAFFAACAGFAERDAAAGGPPPPSGAEGAAKGAAPR